MNVFNISECNIAQMIGETSRFLFHVFLIHIATCIIERRTKDLLSETLFKTLIITAVAIEKMKIICIKNKPTYKQKKNIK